MRGQQDRSESHRPLAAHAAFGWASFFAAVHVYWLAGGTAGLPAGRRVTDTAGLLVADALVTLRDDRIRAITRFLDDDLPRRFGLPETID